MLEVDVSFWIWNRTFHIHLGFLLFFQISSLMVKFRTQSVDLLELGWRLFVVCLLVVGSVRELGYACQDGLGLYCASVEVCALQRIS